MYSIRLLLKFIKLCRNDGQQKEKDTIAKKINNVLTKTTH